MTHSSQRERAKSSERHIQGSNRAFQPALDSISWGAGKGGCPEDLPALTALLLLSDTQPLPKEEALAARGGTGSGAVGPGGVLVTGGGDLNGRELQVFLAGGGRILEPAGLQAVLLHVLHPPHLEALPAQGRGGRAGPGAAALQHLLLGDPQRRELQGFCHVGSWHQTPFLLSAPTPRALLALISCVNHTAKPRLGLAFLLPVSPALPSLSSRKPHVLHVLSFSNPRGGEGTAATRTCHKGSQFRVSFLLLSSTKSPSPASRSRFSTDTRVGSEGLAGFQLRSPAPLWLREGKGSRGCSRKTRLRFFSGGEASMEWSGVELWGGQRERQREGRNKAP